MDTDKVGSRNQDKDSPVRWSLAVREGFYLNFRGAAVSLSKQKLRVEFSQQSVSGIVPFNLFDLGWLLGRP